MVSTLNDTDWDTLLNRIKEGEVTPFLGAGINYGALPLGSDIAKRWAKEEHYPLEDSNDLARVAQFIGLQRKDPMWPKEQILRELGKSPPPDFTAPGDPQGILAELPLPVYLTTNYDDYMFRALKSRNKEPQRELCRWNSLLKGRPSVLDAKSKYRPTEAKPLVFHLHGHNEAKESIVLTEGDYLDFLVAISQNPKLLPPRIQEAMTNASLLFIGYRLADWTFRVIFRGLVASLLPSLQRIHVAVQVAPDAPEEERLHAQEYMTKYFGSSNIMVYWGTAAEFVAELSERWKRFKS